VIGFTHPDIKLSSQLADRAAEREHTGPVSGRDRIPQRPFAGRYRTRAARESKRTSNRGGANARRCSFLETFPGAAFAIAVSMATTSKPLGRP